MITCQAIVCSPFVSGGRKSVYLTPVPSISVPSQFIEKGSGLPGYFIALVGYTVLMWLTRKPMAPTVESLTGDLSS